MWLHLPEGGSQVLAIALGVGWFLFLVGGLRKQVERRISVRAGSWVLRIGGLLAGIGGLLVADKFLFMRQTSGFYLEEVIIVAVMFASLAVAWARAGWCLPAVFVTGWAGLALVLKPVLWPLVSRWGHGPFRPYSLTSETHLYFLLPGIGLLVVLGILLWPLRHRVR